MEDKREFLKCLYKVCDMGYSSTNKLITLLSKKENKIVDDLEKELVLYESSLKKIEEIDSSIKSIDFGILSKIGSDIGMKLELLTDNSDAKIADIMIQGNTMGVTEVSSKLKKYQKELDKDIVKIADDIISYQNKFIKAFKKYL